MAGLVVHSAFVGTAWELAADSFCCPFFGAHLHESHSLPDPQRGACMAHPGVEDEADHGVCTESPHNIRWHPWLAVTNVSKQRVMPKLPNSSVPMVPLIA